MPFCPKCGRNIKEPVTYCPNCGFLVADLFKEAGGTKVPQQAAATPAVAPPGASRIHTAPIKAAAMLCLAIGVVNLIIGLIIFAGTMASPSAAAGSIQFGLILAMILLISGVMHVLGWQRLSRGRKRGGVIGMIAGIIDLAAIFIVLEVMTLLAATSFEVFSIGMPILMPLLAVESILGVILLIAIAIGWISLR